MAINYTQVGWDTAKYVNPTNMNHMDEGIKAACDGVDELQEKIDKVNENLAELNSDLGYIDITDQFTVNSDKVRLFAYAENGMVTIDIQLRPGFNGSVNIANLNNLKYAPRITSYGFYNCTGSGADKNAYLGSYIDRVGTMYVWCDNEIFGIEHVTVLYPIQRN